LNNNKYYIDEKILANAFIIRIIYNATPLDKDKITKQYMIKYGINNVRGGTYINQQLNANELRLLNYELIPFNDAKIKTVLIYVLLLEQNKYFIGYTENQDAKISDIFLHNYLLWTKKYRPIKCVELIPNCDELDIDKITKKYMLKYGIQNVRGGSYLKLELKDWQIKGLQNEFNTIGKYGKIFTFLSNLCFQK
jgi:hypothetical protein